MKTMIPLIGAGAFALLLCVGCQPSDNTEPSQDTPPPAGVAPAEKPPVEERVSIEETVTETAETAKKAISDVNTKAQELLTEAQNLVSEKKYQEAGDLLKKLSDLELTPEQQELLDDLKVAVQKALESDAVKEGTKAIGNILGGQK